MEEGQLISDLLQFIVMPRGLPFGESKFVLTDNNKINITFSEDDDQDKIATECICVMADIFMNHENDEEHELIVLFEESELKEYYRLYQIIAIIYNKCKIENVFEDFLELGVPCKHAKSLNLMNYVRDIEPNYLTYAAIRIYKDNDIDSLSLCDDEDKGGLFCILRLFDIDTILTKHFKSRCQLRKELKNEAKLIIEPLSDADKLEEKYDEISVLTDISSVMKSIQNICKTYTKGFATVTECIEYSRCIEHICSHIDPKCDNTNKEEANDLILNALCLRLLELVLKSSEEYCN